ncbi:DUF3304 domain-containing protein [Obesumbacterium proteus]|uniref:DUF3304 domain-containing protein n=1 Tax=Obesumbacterium proteus TaxID=82983 RepID=UPI001F461C4E|nr:DUF3304 domain-containing protein [Obesumbacterium proteus]MCE9915141.1 DUF3304 domain-containing protein [Obesumbacterium proteus]
MGLFTQLEKFDAALTRSYQIWGRWFWRSLIALAVGYVGYTAWQVTYGPPTGGVSLVIHSELDRPILGFSVNGVAGANAFAHGGGKVTCCGDVSGDTAEVVWTLDVKQSQYEQGMRVEQRHKTMPLPERHRGDKYLHVHFLPGDVVKLGWSADAWSPYETRPNFSQENKVN